MLPIEMKIVTTLATLIPSRQIHTTSHTSIIVPIDSTPMLEAVTIGCFKLFCAIALLLIDNMYYCNSLVCWVAYLVHICVLAQLNWVTYLVHILPAGTYRARPVLSKVETLVMVSFFRYICIHGSPRSCA